MPDLNTINSQSNDIEVLTNELSNGRIFKLTDENKRNPNCIDGRDDDIARPSIPGGKFGALGVVLSTIDSFKDSKTISGSQIKKIIDIVKEKFGGELGGHTDEHKKTEEKGCECNGCGHVFRLLNEGTSEKYNLSKENIKILTENISQTNSANIDILEGNHKERRVIIVEANDVGVKSHGIEGQDFVYNAGYVEGLYSDLAKDISKLLQISEIKVKERIMKIASLHLMSTARDLAGGLPIYTLKSATENENGEYKLEIESSGFVPKAETINDKIIDTLDS